MHNNWNEPLSMMIASGKGGVSWTERVETERKAERNPQY